MKKNFAIRPNSREDLIRAIDDFHSDSRYGGDLHCADMAWAVYAANRGLSREDIAQETLDAHDLSKKGSRSRQTNYAQRTALKALGKINPARRACQGSLWTNDYYNFSSSKLVCASLKCTARSPSTNAPLVTPT